MSQSLPIVLALGHRFSSLEIERATLTGVARVVDANALDEQELAALLQQAAVVMLGTRGTLYAQTITGLARCRAIVRYGIGVDNVAVAQATAQGILIINIPEYCIQEVSDHTVALVLAANRRLIPAWQAASELATPAQPQDLIRAQAGQRRLPFQRGCRARL